MCRYSNVYCGIADGEVPCQNCGAPLSFPVGASGIECPYCHTGTHRI